MRVLIWETAACVVALLLYSAYLEWDFRRFRRRLAVKNREAERLHQEEMRRKGDQFCAWMDKTLAEHFEKYP